MSQRILIRHYCDVVLHRDALISVKYSSWWCAHRSVVHHRGDVLHRGIVLHRDDVLIAVMCSSQ